MPLISIYGTVYNNAYIIKESIMSIRNALENLEDRYELVIVDNYSSDGTWEILLRLKNSINNLKLLRYRCSRGKGRDLALRYTSGEYVMYADFDCIYGKEFGTLIEKLRKICTKGEIWNFGFSTRDTMINLIGGWKDLNFGEDWELLGRAVDRGISIKIIGIKPNYNVRISQNGSYGERRYVSNAVTYMVRRLRNLRDTAIGWKLSPAYVIYSEHNLIRPSVLALLLLSGTYSFLNLERNIFVKSKVYAKAKYLLPQELGLPKDWLFILWADINFTWSAVVKHIENIVKKDPKVNMALLPEKRILIAFRNYKILKDRLRKYVLSTLHSSIGEVKLKTIKSIWIY